MLNVWFIRHAQSQSNAGERTEDPDLIELTARGREQAEHIPALFDHAPDLIIVSPYLRAIQTAEPLLRRFPDVPNETWPVQEFTYLDRKRCLNTTLAERIPMAQTFWDRNEPHYVDGEGTESYAGLMGRVDAMWGRLFNHYDGQWVVVVSHAQYIRAAIWHWMHEGSKATESSMKRFRSFLRAYSIPNGALQKVQHDGEFWYGAVRMEHIPAHMRSN